MWVRVTEEHGSGYERSMRNMKQTGREDRNCTRADRMREKYQGNGILYEAICTFNLFFIVFHVANPFC